MTINDVRQEVKNGFLWIKREKEAQRYNESIKTITRYYKIEFISDEDKFILLNEWTNNRFSKIWEIILKFKEVK